jgi:hypothetical protein
MSQQHGGSCADPGGKSKRMTVVQTICKSMGWHGLRMALQRGQGFWIKSPYGRRRYSLAMWVVVMCLIGLSLHNSLWESVTSITGDGPEMWHHHQSAHGVPSNSSSPGKRRKYLVFVPMKMGQGKGNIVAGLLSAHLLGEEFGRTVCVSPDFDDFLLAFQPLDRRVKTHCARLFKMLEESGDENHVQEVKLVNFMPDPNECKLKDILASEDMVVQMVGNTYPKWCHVPENYFDRFYLPTEYLLRILPYDDYPHTVVHLRAPDGRGDTTRLGLDSNSLSQLGNRLPSDTFLVTNNVEWYTLFENKYGWNHAKWSRVRHTALGISWGGNAQDETIDPRTESLQLWSDWYTILKAKMVYHTVSDFSASAVHWMNSPSKIIHGLDDDGMLNLIDESWRREGDSPRIIDRIDPNDTRSPGFRLQNCPRKLIIQNLN